MSTEGGIDLEEVNPYESHLELTRLEGEVLWEYAKLAKNVKNVRDMAPDASGANNALEQLLLKTRELSEAPDEALLGQLRTLERKMGLVLTLVRTVLMSTCQLFRCYY
jgi:DASH complex subunit DAD3